MSDQKYLRTLKKSSRYPKKYQITVDGKTIHFGDRRYQHYKDKTPIKAYSHLDHMDPERKRRYYARHGKTTDKRSAKYWANKLLW